MLLIDELLHKNSYFGRNMHKMRYFHCKFAKIAQRWRFTPSLRRLQIPNGLRRPRTPSRLLYWEFPATPLMTHIKIIISYITISICITSYVWRNEQTLHILNLVCRSIFLGFVRTKLISKDNFGYLYGREPKRCFPYLTNNEKSCLTY